jgi:hypothetical protein
MAIIHNNNKIPKLQPKKRIKKTSLPLYPYKNIPWFDNNCYLLIFPTNSILLLVQ